LSGFTGDKMKIKKVYINEEKYPEMLKTIADPPNPLYYIGNLSLLDKECIAIVGSRKTNQYGRWTGSECQPVCGSD
jgi:DNA processing protein